jgi:antitoxin ParD1/3/4
MPTRNVVITDYQAKFIEKLVASGRYQNASEVLRDGLRLVEARIAEEKAKLKVLREAVQLGIDDMDAGRYLTFKNGKELAKYLRKLGDEVIRKSAKDSETP